MSFIKFSLDREKSLKNAKLTEKSGGLSNCTVQKKDSLNARCDALHICILCIVYEYEHVLHTIYSNSFNGIETPLPPIFGKRIECLPMCGNHKCIMYVCICMNSLPSTIG